MRRYASSIQFPGYALIIYCLALLALAAGPVPAAGQQSLSAATAKLTESARAEWTINADSLSYDQEKQLYEATGNVKISSKDRMIQADYASVNNQTRQADLKGNVTVQYGRNWLKGEHITWNLDTETGSLDSGIMFFAENNFFIQGKSIAKQGPMEFELKEGFITSCNPSDPDWKIQFNQMKVTVGGTAWARDSSFWARGLPVAYAPLLGMPVEVERQSGFLLPWAGNSTLNGIQGEIPYYWAIREDMDLTFYSRYMENRGFMGGAEFRFNNPELGKGVWLFNFLQDQADPAFLAEHGYPFQTTDRYWLRSRQDLTLPWKIEGKVDLDFVSDRNFLQEFSQGSSSVLSSDRIFRQYFGRGLLYDDTSLVRESTIYLEKRGESDLLSMDLRYWQNLESSLAATTVQKLPSFSFNRIPTGICDTPLYYTIESSAVDYWRREGDTEQRLDIHPRIYYPMHWGNYLDIEPSGGFRTSTYAIQWDNANFDNLNERFAPDAKVEMSSRLNKVIPLDFMDFTAIQHTFRPEVAYEYATQTLLHSQIPHLDRLDEDQARNGIRYGFSTFITGKEVKTDAAGNPTTTYRELIRFRAFQFFNGEPPSVEDPLFDTQVLKEGFSPVALRLDVMPKKYLTLSYDVDLDIKGTGQGNSHDLYMIADSGKGQILRIDYQQIPDLSVNEITAETLLKTYGNIYLNAYYDYSLDQGLTFRQGYGVRYIRGCWGLGVGYEREGSDNRFVFTIDLLGLGSLGQSQFFGKAQFGEPRPEYQRPESWNLSR